MNSLSLKKTMLVLINVLASLAAGEVGFRTARNFLESNAYLSVLITLFTGFLISAFCLSNAYQFSQKFEETKTTRKEAIMGTFKLWALISLIMLAALFYKKLIQ